MRAAHKDLIKTHIIGSRSRERIVGPGECPALNDEGIQLCGLSDVAPPYRMVRPHVGWSEVIVTLAGRGRVLADGKWRGLQSGEAYVAPHHVAQAFFADGGRWRFVWVQFSKRLAGSEAQVVTVDGEDLAAMVSALHHEVLGARDRGVLAHLAALVARLGERAGGGGSGERLEKLWREVDADLSREWSVTSMAARVGMSGEHLRRVCLAERGVTPMQHVGELRMRRATAMLRSTPTKIETIASEVGYGSVYAFSAAFKRWAGHSPGTLRR
jgi:AraC-like DNA-binding protein